MYMLYIEIIQEKALLEIMSANSANQTSKTNIH